MKKHFAEYWTIGGLNTNGRFIMNMKQAFMMLGIDDTDFSVFDSHFGITWNGGRLAVPAQDCPTKEEFARRVAACNNAGIGFNLVFSNLFLEKHHLDDKRGNFLLESCCREGNGVIIASPVLAEYVAARFPQYTRIHSLTHMHMDPHYYIANKDLYDIFVLPAELNHNEKVIEQLCQEIGGSRLEVIVNELCYDGCPWRKKHYELFSTFSIKADWDLYEKLEDEFCVKSSAVRYAEKKSDMALSGFKRLMLEPADIDWFLHRGITRFKLAGRRKPAWQVEGWINHYIIYRRKIMDAMLAVSTEWQLRRDRSSLMEPIRKE